MVPVIIAGYGLVLGLGVVASKLFYDTACLSEKVADLEKFTDETWREVDALGRRVDSSEQLVADVQSLLEQRTSFMSKAAMERMAEIELQNEDMKNLVNGLKTKVTALNERVKKAEEEAKKDPEKVVEIKKPSGGKAKPKGAQKAPTDDERSEVP